MKRFTPKVVSANALLEGDAVWLAADDRWSRDMADAELIDDEARAAVRLQFAKGQLGIVGAELVDAVPGEGGPVPTHFREAFRTRGPTNYRLGKQADGLRTRGTIPGNR